MRRENANTYLVSSPATGSAEWPPDDRLRRVTQYSRDANDRTEKPAGAWTPEQTVDFMIQHIDTGDFYILCPDNDVPRQLDERRMQWAAGDIIENRPALSRWHPDYAEAFARFVKGG